MMTGKIFINYRRGDDPGNTGRLFDHLRQAFAAEQLFMDVDSIGPGFDFVQVLQEQVSACDVLLAVIGPRWLGAADKDGNRRLDSSHDFVRIEIESALGQDKRVIPVLVGEARMPPGDELPNDMRPLVRRNAVRLTHERFHADTQGLIKALEQALDDAEAKRRAEAETARRAAADNERKLQEAAAVALAQAQHEADQQERHAARAGLSPEQIAKAEELANWDFIKESNSAQDFRDHLARFPGGACERIARHRLATLLWASLGKKPDRQVVLSYLEEFADGVFAEQAKARLAALDRDSRRQMLGRKWRIPAALIASAVLVAMIAVFAGDRFRPSPEPSPVSELRLESVPLKTPTGKLRVGDPNAPKPPPSDPAGTRLRLIPPTAFGIEGPRGGPFSPRTIQRWVWAEGPGFRWSVKKPDASWIQVSPDHGVLGDNERQQLEFVVTDEAQFLQPGRYNTSLTFTNDAGATDDIHFVLTVKP
jgi:hypothetical protein